jgi:hypothetical protein
MVFVPLNQRASGNPSAGAVTISFPSPPIGRIWQGSLTIPGAASTDVWKVTLAYQLVAVVTGSGPFGPLQIQAGQVLSLAGTVSLTTPYTAILSGIDDPADDASPYTGPAALPAAGSTTTGTVGGLTLGKVAQALLINAQGEQYVIPSAPSTASGDHPPNELQVAPFNGVTTNAFVLNAPGLGKRYRIFGGDMVDISGSFIYAFLYAVFNGVSTVIGGLWSSGSGQLTGMQLIVPLSGLAADANTAVTIGTGANATKLYGAVYYTLETV